MSRPPAPTDIRRWFEEADYVAGRTRAGMPSGYAPGGAPAGAGPSPRANHVLLPPTYIRPDRAHDFHVAAASPIGTPFSNANTPAVIPGSAFVIPTSNVGVIRSLNLNVNTLLATSRLTWTLRFDGVPVQGWDALTVFPRAAGSFTLAYGPDETQIPVPDGATIDVVFAVDPLDGASYQAGVDVGGWFYDRNIQEAFASAWRP